MNNYNFSDMRKPAIFSAQSYGTKTTVEIDHSDLSLDEVMDAFHTLIVGMGFSPDTWKQWIMERATEYQEEDGHTEIEHTNSHWNYVKAAMEQDEQRYENLRHNTDDVKYDIDETGAYHTDENWDVEWPDPNEDLKKAADEYLKKVKNKKKK